MYQRRCYSVISAEYRCQHHSDSTCVAHAASPLPLSSPCPFCLIVMPGNHIIFAVSFSHILSRPVMFSLVLACLVSSWHVWSPLSPPSPPSRRDCPGGRPRGPRREVSAVAAVAAVAAETDPVVPCGKYHFVAYLSRLMKRPKRSAEPSKARSTKRPSRHPTNKISQPLTTQSCHLDPNQQPNLSRKGLKIAATM